MKHETYYSVTWEVNTVGNEIWPVYTILQNNFFYQKILRKMCLKTSSRPFLIFKESSLKGICGGQHADLDKL